MYIHRVEYIAYIFVLYTYITQGQRQKPYRLIYISRFLSVFTKWHETLYDNISCQSSFRKLVINHFSNNFSNLCCLLAMRSEDICTLPPPIWWLVVSWAAAVFIYLCLSLLMCLLNPAVVGGCFALPYLLYTFEWFLCLKCWSGAECARSTFHKYCSTICPQHFYIHIENERRCVCPCNNYFYSYCSKKKSKSWQ